MGHSFNCVHFLCKVILVLYKFHYQLDCVAVECMSSVQNVCANAALNKQDLFCKLQMLDDYTYWPLMQTHLHIWHQHLLNENSCVCQRDCCGSPQVGSQYQYKLHCPDEWAQFPGQRRHVGRVLTLNGECNECNLIVQTIWIRSMLLIFFFTFKWLNDYLCFN